MLKRFPKKVGFIFCYKRESNLNRAKKEGWSVVLEDNKEVKYRTLFLCEKRVIEVKPKVKPKVKLEINKEVNNG